MTFRIWCICIMRQTLGVSHRFCRKCFEKGVILCYGGRTHERTPDRFPARAGWMLPVLDGDVPREGDFTEAATLVFCATPGLETRIQGPKPRKRARERQECGVLKAQGWSPLWASRGLAAWPLAPRSFGFAQGDLTSAPA